MIHVPRPNLNVRVFLPDGGSERVFRVVGVDHIKRTFDVVPFEVADNKPWRVDIPIDTDYKPCPDRYNFEQALKEWDEEYKNSDDPNVYEAGKQQEKALYKMFKSLKPVDHLHYKKLLFITTCVE